MNPNRPKVSEWENLSFGIPIGGEYHLFERTTQRTINEYHHSIARYFFERGKEYGREQLAKELRKTLGINESNTDV